MHHEGSSRLRQQPIPLDLAVQCCRDAPESVSPLQSCSPVKLQVNVRGDLVSHLMLPVNSLQQELTISACESVVAKPSWAKLYTGQDCGLLLRVLRDTVL